MSMRTKRIIVNTLASMLIIGAILILCIIGNYIVDLISGKANNMPAIITAFGATLIFVGLEFSRESR